MKLERISDDNIIFQGTMVWSSEDSFKTVQEYIQSLLNKIEELKDEITDLKNNN